MLNSNSDTNLWLNLQHGMAINYFLNHNCQLIKQVSRYPGVQFRCCSHFDHQKFSITITIYHLCTIHIVFKSFSLFFFFIK